MRWRTWEWENLRISELVSLRLLTIVTTQISTAVKGLFKKRKYELEKEDTNLKEVIDQHSAGQ